MTDWAKQIAAKTALASRSIEQGMKPGKASDNARIPPGQSRVSNFPVLDMGVRPVVSRATWSLKLYGAVAQECLFNWEQFLALPQTKVEADMHCVTRWSQLDMTWQGVLARDIIALAKPDADAQFVTLHGLDGYTTNVPLATLIDDDVLIAHSVFGAPLSEDHGWPARMIVPKLYAWKGAKWLSALEFHVKDKPGFWEQRGYHNVADPFREERFGYFEE
jgi:DMSO/TMAO reductase YedYZ molybdopterin-dependent catalytic subunit